MQIEEIVKAQHQFFSSGKTFDIGFRVRMLTRLENAILKYEKALYAALKEELGKSKEEAYMCEIGLTLAELRYVKRHVNMWSKVRAVPSPLAQFPSKSFTVQEPYGVVLVMAPWNYPVLLALEPLIGAIAAGNCCIIKTSEYSPKTSRVIAELLGEVFPKRYVTAVTGGKNESQKLLAQNFDYIFFTGSETVGKLVMKQASAHLTPVTLELGGKSPCIVDKTADLKLAAKRIVFGKYLNCGQTCVAPDYILVERSVHEPLVTFIKKEICRMYGSEPLKNQHYGKMINCRHFERVLGLIDAQKLIYGGAYDLETLKIEPTLLDNVNEEDAVMQEEIFGPLLPILTVDSMDEAYAFVKKQPHPLALYLFTGSRETENRFVKGLAFGGGCINDTVIHLATSHMGFGGVGNSGMGSYHGKKSFDTFSHEKSIVKKYNWLDLPMRYQPYCAWKSWLVRQFLR